MIKVEFHRAEPFNISLAYVVIAARHNSQWMFVRHKERSTYEIPGGHIESGEDYIAAAKRELYEETGAKNFALDFVSIYTVTTDEKFSGGYLFFADVKELSTLPDYEMAEVVLMDQLPENLTYPLIQPHLFNRMLDWMTGRRLEWSANKHFSKSVKTEDDFWSALDKLVSESKIIVDRPKGSHHLKYPNMVYPVDYGYLDNTTSMDGDGIDVWKGSSGDYIDAIICTVDLLKKDSEIKILIGCSEEEKWLVLETHNNSEYMKGILMRRDT